MYAKNNNNVRYFKDEKENTEKVVYGRVSEAIKTNRKGEDGKDIYEYENWPARFVGKAYEKAKTLADKTVITLVEWSAHCPYNKDKKKFYPYMMVMDFEVREKNESSESGSVETGSGDGFMNIPDGLENETPFA